MASSIPVSARNERNGIAPLTGTAAFRPLEFVFGAVLLIAIAGTAILSGWLLPDPTKISLSSRLVPPLDAAHPLERMRWPGTFRARCQRRLDFAAGRVHSWLLGLWCWRRAMGLVAGYYRGIWDMILMRFADAVPALPFIPFTSSPSASRDRRRLDHQHHHPADCQPVGAICASGARFRRKRLREREFVPSARVTGVADRNIIMRHLLPNLLGPAVVLMTLNVVNKYPARKLADVFWTWVDPRFLMGGKAEGRTYLQTAWWIVVPPAILLTVLGLNLLGDWLRDSADPTGRTSC